MRVGYFIWLEDLDSDIVKSQVLDVLEEIAGNHDTDITVVVFARTYHYFANRQVWKRIRLEVARRGLRLVVLPLVFLPDRLQLYFANWYLIPVIAAFAWPAMLTMALLGRLSILHFRSYPLALSAILLKALLPGRKVVFDTRSPFPEESVASNKWLPGSLTFRLWKKIESQAVARLDATVFVTRAHRNMLSAPDAATLLTVIPNNAAAICIDAEARLSAYAGRLASYRKNFCIAYVGSLSRRGVSNPDIYAQLIVRLRKLQFSHSFLFVTREGDLLKGSFERHGIAASEYCVESCAPEHVSLLLTDAHVGLNFLKNPDVRMSVKTAEYVVAGLPLLCNENALGAREVIEDYRIGVVAAPDSLEEQVTNLFENYGIFLERAQAMRDYFSTERISAEYHGLYEKLMH